MLQATEDLRGQPRRRLRLLWFRHRLRRQEHRLPFSLHASLAFQLLFQRLPAGRTNIEFSAVNVLLETLLNLTAPITKDHGQYLLADSSILSQLHTSAVFFYFGAQTSRELTFAVNPVRTTVVNAGGASAIRIFHNDQEIKSDVTAEQIEIWNAGKLPIRPDSVLEPVTLSLRPAAQILEVKIRKPARSATGFRVDTAGLASGKVGLSWRILEHDDGVVIQVLDTGRPGTKITVAGTIEGQHEIGEVEIPDIARPYTSGQRAIQFAVSMLPVSIFLLPIFAKSSRFSRFMDALIERGALVFVIGLGIILAAILGWTLLVRHYLFPALVPPAIPFAF